MLRYLDLQGDGGEAQKAYQKLVIALFNHIEDVASGNPKYEHMVRLENYHFFAATIRPLKVSKPIESSQVACFLGPFAKYMFVFLLYL